MTFSKFLTANAVFFCLLLTSCKKDIRPADNLAMINTQANSKASKAQISSELNAKLNKLVSSLPNGYENRVMPYINLLQADQEYRNKVYRALKAIAPTPCNDNTMLNQWLDDQLSDWNNTVISYALFTGMLDFPTYDALLFENSSANQYFGLNGEYTQRVQKTFKDLKRFWNIESSNIVLAAMHGNMLLNREKVIRIDKILYNDTQEIAEYFADLIITLLQAIPQYRNGDHPIFTFNAFAQPAFEFPPYGFVPDKIIMGDGIMQAYTGIGYGDIAPQAILAHEFGHHIQFQLGLFADSSSPEATRRTELMADAFSAYYLSHARGASMQWKRVKQFLQVFFNIGDCAFTNNGHHGTPTQRMAAAEWAYNVANDAQKQGQILTSQQFVALFEAQLPELITH